ncbi:MAG TPA: response regulator [Micropepsaceae bacterium]|nr:response regulator [Micropepsaceae bacterium]
MKTILIVDDEYGIVQFLTDLLADQGYRAVTAANGKQALDRIEETKPDLVLLDFTMPIMDGAATLKALTDNPATRDIPVVMMSSFFEPTVTEACGPYAAFLRKPFKVQAVVDLVTRLIGKAEAD